MSGVQRREFSVQRRESSVQSPESRVQRPESDIQSPASKSCFQSPGIPVCPFVSNFYTLCLSINVNFMFSVNTANKLKITFKSVLLFHHFHVVHRNQNSATKRTKASSTRSPNGSTLLKFIISIKIDSFYFAKHEGGSPLFIRDSALNE